MKTRVKRGIAVALALAALTGAATLNFSHTDARHMLRTAGHWTASR